MEGVKWLESIAKQLSPAASVEAASLLNMAFACSLGCLFRECWPSRSCRAAVEQWDMKKGIDVCPRVHKPGVIAQAKLVEISALMQFHWGFERNFYIASFSLTNPKPFICDDWHQPPVAHLGLDSSYMLCFTVNLSTLLPCPLSTSPPFKFFIDLMPPWPGASKQLFPESFGLVAWAKWAWKKNGSRLKTWRGHIWAPYRDWKS